MGCESSRVQQRNKFCDDLNTVQLNFIGGECHTLDGCPVDKFVISQTGEPEQLYQTSGLEATDEAAVKSIYKSTYVAVKTALNSLTEQKGNCRDSKEPYVGGKYKLSEAIAQLQSVLASFEKCSGIEAAGPKNQGFQIIEDLVENGEDEQDYQGWKNVPALFLKQAISSPYFGDLIRAQVIAWEFNTRGLKTSNNMELQFLRAAGLMGAAVQTAEKEQEEIWFSGLVGDEDFNSLKEMVPDQRPILFPGVIVGWENHEKAKAALKKLESHGDQKTHKVIFRVNGANVLQFLGCRYLCHRLSGQAVAHNEEQGHHQFEIYTSPLSDSDIMSIAEWEETFEPRVW